MVFVVVKLKVLFMDLFSLLVVIVVVCRAFVDGTVVITISLRVCAYLLMVLLLILYRCK